MLLKIAQIKIVKFFNLRLLQFLILSLLVLKWSTYTVPTLGLSCLSFLIAVINTQVLKFFLSYFGVIQKMVFEKKLTISPL